MNRLPLSVVTSDKRIWLFLLSGALAVVLGFLALSGTAAITFVSRTGFWFLLVAFVLFLRALWLTFGDYLRGWRWRTFDWVSAIVVGVAGTVLLVHEAFGFKIIMDEIMLLGTSMSMHFDKTVLTPMRGNDIQGAFVILDGIMDKRPLFFPFLVSLLHDLTGYRPANVFVLNGILTFVFLGLVNVTGRLLAGRLAGWIGVALCAGLPLLAQNATGGGFELLNLVMIIATLLLGARFVQQRDEVSLTAFCFSALLMVQVRYESMIFLLPVVILILWVWMGEGRVILSWPVIFAPLLLIPYPLQHRIFELRGSAWELASQPGYEHPFSAGYIPDNLVHAVNFFFASPKDQPNSLVLSVIGWIALPFCLLLVAKQVRALRAASPVTVATTVFMLGFIGQFLLMMCYFWGKFDDVVIRRLSLPTHLWLVIAVMMVLTQFSRVGFQRLMLGIAIVCALISGVPSMAAHAYDQEYLPGREVAWRRQFIADQPRNDYLMIDNDSILWIAHEVSATPVVQAKNRRDAILFHFRNHTFSAIYVFQQFSIDPESGKMTLRDGDDLGPDFVLEPVREARLKTLTLSRISRLTEIRKDGASLTAKTEPEPTVPKSREEIERLRKAYLEQFVKQLP